MSENLPDKNNTPTPEPIPALRVKVVAANKKTRQVLETSLV